jgi:hypothetical protein
MIHAIIVDPPGGGLGNLLFQHHIGMALALQYKVPFIIKNDNPQNENDTQRPRYHEYHPLFQHIQLKTGIEIYRLYYGKRVYFHQESGSHYQPITIPEDAEIIILKGFFQSYKYFQTYHDEIMNQLHQNMEAVLPSIREDYERYAQEKETVCVHIRRTDYLKAPEFHPILPEDYYRLAIKNHLEKRILVFSDDIELIRDWELWKECNSVFITETDPLRSIYLMSFCNVFVIANSSMSLNAYYMRSHKEAPLYVSNTWFGPKGPPYQIDDFVPLKHTTILYEPYSSEIVDK